MDPLNLSLDKMSLTDNVSNEEKIKEAIKKYLIDNNEMSSSINDKKTKDAKKSEEKVNEADENFLKSSLFSVIELYTQAVACAPNDSRELAVAYGNRSAALSYAKLYEDSLKDIERALKLDYPDNLRARLFARQVKNLLALNSKIRQEVKEALAQTNYWMTQMDETNKKIVQSILNKLNQRNSTAVPYKKWDSSKFLPEVPADNHKIPRASSAISLEYSEKYGRHIVATRDVKACETLLVHKAYASILHVENIWKYCWYCSKRTWSSVPCNQCANVIYCDENCRNAAWNEYHDFECPVIAAMFSHEFNSVFIMSLRLTIKAFKEAGSLENLKEKLQDIDSITDPMARGLTDDVWDDTKYASVYSLTRNSPDTISEQCLKKSIGILYCLITTTKMFDDKIDIENLADDKWANFVGELILKHVEISRANAIQLRVKRDPDTFVPYCDVLMPFFSLFNHSCDPNVHKFTSGNINAIFATRVIKKGEQIVISYGPRFQNLSTAERRQHLQVHKFFCQCIACSNNWGPEYRLPSCQEQSLPVEIKNKLTTTSRYLSFVRSMWSNADKTSKYIKETLYCLSEIINTYCEHVEYPCLEIEACKDFLEFVYRYISDH
ncbi:SET and MYND domain-containing protein 4-like [Microplitis mediator]|uniref:SET and MYND domain-containing protein 4-like n=1 Tax=Microplitis mediator TaxID=375433 RepID=UPI00255452FB|nr:SET and MYND domain-containing protein 4-like [Microplitis mediator]